MGCNVFLIAIMFTLNSNSVTNKLNTLAWLHIRTAQLFGGKRAYNIAGNCLFMLEHKVQGDG